VSAVDVEWALINRGLALQVLWQDSTRPHLEARELDCLAAEMVADGLHGLQCGPSLGVAVGAILDEVLKHLPAVAIVEQLHRLAALLLLEKQLLVVVEALIIKADQIDLGVRVLGGIPRPGRFEAGP